MIRAQKQPPILLKPSPLPSMPSRDEKMEALRVAVRALLTHGARPDIVVQAQHALDLSKPVEIVPMSPFQKKVTA